MNTSDPSPASAPVTPRTAEPSAPAKPFAEVLSPTSARIWVSPGVGGGVSVTYDVTASGGGGSCVVTVPATSCVISGLSATPYTFTTTATNTYGTSGVSPTSDSITPSQPFTMKWDTMKSAGGASGSRDLRLPLVNDGTYNFNVSWGDGTGGTVTSAGDPDANHTYATGGEKTVTISGRIEGWSFGADQCLWYSSSTGRDGVKLLEISNWGPLRLDTALEKDYYFCWAQNLQITATDSPYLGETTSLKGAFYNASNVNASLNSWDVSHVTDMSYMFYGASKFNSSLSWTTTNVTDMNSMFQGASVFNQPVGSWNTANVTNMSAMFQIRVQIQSATEYLEHSSSDEHERDVQQCSGIQRQCLDLEHGQCH